MSLGLALPAALTALLALAIPVLLHLVRRRQPPQVVVLATMRWIGAGQRPQHRLRVHDPLLLVLRCLLLAWVVLALSLPYWQRAGAGRPWQVVVPGLDPATLALPTAAGERRWLAPGFPPLDAPTPSAPRELASLLRELDTRLDPDTALSVYLPARLHGLDGAALALGRRVDWHVVDDVEDDDGQTSVAAAPLPRVAIAGTASEGRFVDAALHALGIEPLRLDAAAPIPPPSPIDVVLWTDPAPLPPALSGWLADGGRVLATAALIDDDSGVVLWQGRGGARLRGARIDRGQLRALDCPLSTRCLPELLEPGFPALLLDWLTPERPAVDAAMAADVAPTVVERRLPAPRRSLFELFAVVAAALFVAERWRATRSVPR